MATLTKKMPLTAAVVALQRGLVVLPEQSDKDHLALASTVQSNLLTFGYMLDNAAFQMLRFSPMQTIINFHDEVMEYLKEATGGKKAYTPKYGDFPVDIMTEEDAAIMEAAIQYYSFKGDFTGFTSVLTRPVATWDKLKPTVLKSGTWLEFDKIFTDIVSVNQSLLPQDMEVIDWFVNRSGRDLVFPDQIPFKENLCTLAGMGIPGLPVKTPTDVLRIAVHMSGGDISLPAVPPANVANRQLRSPYRWSTSRTSTTVPNPDRDKFRFKKFSRKERKYLLELLECTNCKAEEMVIKDQRWIRLGEILHPGEFQKQYPRAFNAFNAIRNTKVRSWYSQVNKAIMEDLDLLKGLKILQQRPGEFARRMDWLVRTFVTDTKAILSHFSQCVGGVSNKVLYELYGHFAKRDKPTENRSVMIKGARKRTPLPDLPGLDHITVKEVKEGIIGALETKFSTLEKLGKVYIDPELRKIPLPTNMRSVNFSLKPTVRGQRTPMCSQGAKFVRAFFHWTDEDGTLDPDLSATFVKETGESQPLSYHQLSVGKSCHSGDIIARRGDNAEYVDVDIVNALSLGYRFVTIDVRNYRGGTLAEMNGMFGVMERKEPHSSKTWKPDTISNCHACQSDKSNTLMCILDLKTMEYIFLDVDSEGSTVAARDRNYIINVIAHYSQLPEVSIAHLLEWHTNVRGEKVDKEEEADIVFKFDDFAHDYIKTAAYMGV